MNRKYLLPALALCGLIFGIFTIALGMRKPPIPPIAFPPPVPPYEHYVAGAGTVEAASQDISISTPFNNIVSHIHVQVGDRVQEGDPLFELDIRTLAAELEESKKRRDVAIVNYENNRTQLKLYENLKDKRAVSENEFNQRFYAAELALKQIQETEALIEVIETNIERSTIRAPIAGQVLRINIRVGESAEMNPFNNEALIVFGKTDVLHIRVEIDEDDAWRIVKGSPGRAYVRGNSTIDVPLEFLYIEPYIIPKTRLTGDNTERVDTRILQVVYQMAPNDYPIYPGQIMDVYIKGLPSNEKF